MQRAAEGPERAFVLGLDGVPWRLIERWTDAGELPNFARIREEGAAGELRSTTPAVTSLAWPSIATGNWPGEHGIYGFRRVTPDYGQRMNTSDDVRRPALWDVLTPAVVGNVPLTYPAGPLEGRMVTGMTTPATDEGFAWPPGLAEDVRERIPDYRIGLQWGDYAGRVGEFMTDLDSLVASRRALMELLMETEDWRLFFFVYTAPDRLQHLVWDDATLLEHYRTLDGILGDAMGYARDRDAALFVVSDHGFGPVEGFVRCNRVLEEAGYLSRQSGSGTRGILARAGVSRERVRSALDSLGLSPDRLLRYLPRSLVERVAAGIPGSHGLYDVDHAGTEAFVVGTDTLYVNDVDRFENGTVGPADVPRIKRELTGLFEGVVHPETGERLLEVGDGADLFDDDRWAPDLVVEGRPGYETITGLDDAVYRPADGPKVAGHRPEGVFLAWGPGIQGGAAPEGATVVDVAPTVLHAVDEPVGKGMNGRVLREVFAGTRAEDPVARAAYEGDAGGPGDAGGDDYEAVEERLRGLGYIE